MLSSDKKVKCLACDGTGTHSYIEDHTEEEVDEPCSVCDGEGEATTMVQYLARKDDE